MMLQGHFVYELLGDRYKVASESWYVIWKFCRGFTAPIFFTITGLVIVYLLLRHPDPGYQKRRWNKGMRRGFYLIFWGYILRISLWSWLGGVINPSFWLLDVLHCIGLAMLAILSLYWLLNKWSIPIFAGSCLGVGMFIFLWEPQIATWHFPHAPWFLQPYFDRSLGSTFTPLPWIGYSLIGSFIGFLYAYYYGQNKLRQSIFTIGFSGVGVLLTYHSADFLMTLFYQLDCHLCKSVAYNNYLLVRLGHIFMMMGVFIISEQLLKKWTLFNRIGQQTLNIYIVHYVLLYGSWFGLGLTFLIPATLNPFLALVGAVLFLVTCSYLGLNIPKWKRTVMERYEKSSFYLKKERSFGSVLDQPS